VISGFCHEEENCACLVYYSASSTNFLDVLDSSHLKMGPTACPEPRLRNYHYSLHNNPEEQNSQPVLRLTE